MEICIGIGTPTLNNQLIFGNYGNPPPRNRRPPRIIRAPLIRRPPKKFWTIALIEGPGLILRLWFYFAFYGNYFEVLVIDFLCDYMYRELIRRFYYAYTNFAVSPDMLTILLLSKLWKITEHQVFVIYQSPKIFFTWMVRFRHFCEKKTTYWKIGRLFDNVYHRFLIEGPPK